VTLVEEGTPQEPKQKEEVEQIMQGKCKIKFQVIDHTGTELYLVEQENIDHPYATDVYGQLLKRLDRYKKNHNQIKVKPAGLIEEGSLQPTPKTT